MTHFDRREILKSTAASILPIHIPGLQPSSAIAPTHLTILASFGDAYSVKAWTEHRLEHALGDPAYGPHYKPKIPEYVRDLSALHSPKILSDCTSGRFGLLANFSTAWAQTLMRVCKDWALQLKQAHTDKEGMKPLLTHIQTTQGIYKKDDDAVRNTLTHPSLLELPGLEPYRERALLLATNRVEDEGGHEHGTAVLRIHLKYVVKNALERSYKGSGPILSTSQLELLAKLQEDLDSSHKITVEMLYKLLRPGDAFGLSSSKTLSNGMRYLHRTLDWFRFDPNNQQPYYAQVIRTLQRDLGERFAKSSTRLLQIHSGIRTERAQDLAKEISQVCSESAKSAIEKFLRDLLKQDKSEALTTLRTPPQKVYIDDDSLNMKLLKIEAEDRFTVA